MLTAILVAAALLLSAVPKQVPAGGVKVKIVVVLVDKDLNLKPVPRLALSLRPLGVAGEPAPINIRTGLDGTAEVQLSAGRYQLSTPQPIEFQGKKYSWEKELNLSGPQQTVELSNDNASVAAGAPDPAPAAEDLTVLFQRLQNSVVTVRSESNDGTGFIMDPAGLVLSNHHVAGTSDYIAVQFDRKRKIPARLLASDADKDIAVLWIDLSAFPEAVIAPLAKPEGSQPLAVQGEKVFTIGHPFRRDKTLTSGLVSRVEPRAIISDINIKPGSSGGPLFNYRGQVVGITTATQAGLTNVVPIEDARPLLEQARSKVAGQSPPKSTLLPVEPADMFPAEPLQALLRQEKFDANPYFFEIGNYRVGVLTPVVNYWLAHEDEMKAARAKAKRAKSDPSSVAPSQETLDHAKEITPVIVVRVSPKFGGFFKVRYKTDFLRMRLRCSGKEVAPIDPGRVKRVLRNPTNDVVDTTYQGLYTYHSEAIAPSCGQVMLEIFSENDPNVALTQVLPPLLVQRVWNDFEPYRKATTQAAAPRP